MKKLIFILSYGLLFSSIFWTFKGFAQYQLKWSVFGNGATTTSNTTHQLQGTAGQALIGVTQHTSLQQHIGFWYQIPQLPTSVETLSFEVPLEYRLEQNFPNPFNPATTISFALRARGEVTVKIFDLLGREITTLLKEELPAGVHQVVFDATELPSGVYLYRIQTEGFCQTRKLLLVK
ncbi:T9SS type A sorting domain-containing protein [candidate division KSB1 bacterium]|nr:T9SS type A sorting domain-containing protein [candidate division KSB1 bacterium]